MKLRRSNSNAPGRRWQACVCLLAVLLLWAPAWAAAYQAQGMACCADGMCPAHGHAPQKTPRDVNSQNDAQPATCEHHAGKPAMDCSMACCHAETPVVGGAVVFLLPAPSVLAAPLAVLQPAPHRSVFPDSFTFDPASPPPRS